MGARVARTVRAASVRPVASGPTECGGGGCARPDRPRHSGAWRGEIAGVLGEVAEAACLAWDPGGSGSPLAVSSSTGAAYGRGRPPRVCACSRFHRSSSRIPSRMFHAPSAITRGRLCCMMLGNWLLVQDAPGRLLTPVAPTATAGWPTSGRSVVWTADARVIASLSSGVEIWDQAWRFFPGGRTNRSKKSRLPDSCAYFLRTAALFPTPTGLFPLPWAVGARRVDIRRFYATSIHGPTPLEITIRRTAPGLPVQSFAACPSTT